MSFFSNIPIGIKPMSEHRFRRYVQWELTRMKRRHYTGKLLPGIVIPMSSEKMFLEVVEKDEALRDMVEAAQQPEVCYCKNRESHR